MKDIAIDTLHLFVKSWHVFNKHFKSFFWVAVIFVGSFFACFIGLFLIGVIVEVLTANGQYLFYKANIFIVLIFVLIFSLWSVFYNAVIIKMVERASQNQPIKLLDIFIQARAVFIPLLIVSCLVVIKVLLWSLLFVIPGIIFGLFYAFSQFSVVVDGARGQKALRESCRLIRPNFGDFIFKYASMFVLSLSFYFLLRSSLSAVPIAGAVLSFVVQFFLSIYLTIFLYYVYRGYKDKKLSGDEAIQDSVITGSI